MAFQAADQPPPPKSAKPHTRKFATPGHAAPRPEEAPGSGCDAGERKTRDLEELLSKLNPMAEVFVPPSLASPVAAGGAALVPVPAPLSRAAYGYYPANAGFAVASPGYRGVVGFPAVADGPAGRGRKMGGAGGFGDHGHSGRRRTNSRTSMAQWDEVIRLTVCISDIDHQDEIMASVRCCCAMGPWGDG